MAQSERVQVVADGDWTRHNFSDQLPHGRTVKIQGERITSQDGQEGCRFSGSDTETADQTARNDVTITRELATNLTTCEMVLETATLPQAEATQFDPSAVDDGPGPTAESSAGDVTILATTVGRYQKLYYEDPPQIDVTSITARVRWTYTGTCTTWSRHSVGWGWFEQSGWSRTASWWGHDLSCQWGATTSNTGTYRNNVFCDGLPGSNMWDTWNRYNTNYVQGKSNGSVYYEWDAQKWGGCTNLLSFHRATGSWAG